MALTAAQYWFDDDAPTVAEIIERAETLGGLPLASESFPYGAVQVEFDFMPGVVKIKRSPDEVFLSTETGIAPVLFDLLCATVGDFGGRENGDRHVSLELPLTEERVEQATQAFRDRFNRFAGRLWRAVAIIVLIALGLVGLLVWALWALILS